MEIIAHRGASAELPEHTLAAYERAVEQGADGVECDIRLTRDGELVCVHDRDFVRVAGDRRIVSELTLAEMESINVGTEDRPERPLVFRDLLELVEANGLSFFIETKHPVRYGGRVEHALQEMLLHFGLADSPQMHVISFSPKSLAVMRHLNPKLHRILLRRELQRPLGPALWSMDIPQAYGPSIIKARLRPDLVNRGDGCYVWTANREGDVRWAQRHGVDWLATDKPGEARAWLAALSGAAGAAAVSGASEVSGVSAARGAAKKA